MLPQKRFDLLFVEVQRMNRIWWVMVLVYGCAALCWWGFVIQIIFGEPWGSNPAPDWMMWIIWLGFGIGLPAFFNLLRLEVSVDGRYISIRYYPLVSRDISLDEVDQYEVRRYSALKEYGGWGIRGIAHKKAYNVHGNEGVELTLRDGSKIMIGSQKAEDLAVSLTRVNAGLNTGAL